MDASIFICLRFKDYWRLLYFYLLNLSHLYWWHMTLTQWCWYQCQLLTFKRSICTHKFWIYFRVVGMNAWSQSWTGQHFKYILPWKVVVYDHLLQAGGDAAAGLSRRWAHVLRGLPVCHLNTGRVRESCVDLPQDPGQRTQLGGCTLWI